MFPGLLLFAPMGDDFFLEGKYRFLPSAHDLSHTLRRHSDTWLPFLIEITLWNRFEQRVLVLTVFLENKQSIRLGRFFWGVLQSAFKSDLPINRKKVFPVKFKFRETVGGFQCNSLVSPLQKFTPRLRRRICKMGRADPSHKWFQVCYGFVPWAFGLRFKKGLLDFLQIGEISLKKMKNSIWIDSKLLTEAKGAQTRVFHSAKKLFKMGNSAFMKGMMRVQFFRIWIETYKQNPIP